MESGYHFWAKFAGGDPYLLMEIPYSGKRAWAFTGLIFLTGSLGMALTVIMLFDSVAAFPVLLAAAITLSFAFFSISLFAFTNTSRLPSSFKETSSLNKPNVFSSAFKILMMGLFSIWISAGVNSLLFTGGSDTPFMDVINLYQNSLLPYPALLIIFFVLAYPFYWRGFTNRYHIEDYEKLLWISNYQIIAEDFEQFKIDYQNFFKASGYNYSFSSLYADAPFNSQRATEDKADKNANQFLEDYFSANQPE